MEGAKSTTRCECVHVLKRPSSCAWIWWWYNFNPKRPRVEVVFPFHIKSSSHSNTSSSPIATCSAFVSLSLLYTSHTGHVCVLVSLGFLFPSVETLNAFWHICQYVCKIFTLLPEAIVLNKNAMTLSWFGFYSQRTNFRAENIFVFVFVFCFVIRNNNVQILNHSNSNGNL